MLIVCYYYLLTLFSINKVRNSSVNIQFRRQTEEKGDKSDFMASNHLWSDWLWISVIFSSLETIHTVKKLYRTRLLIKSHRKASFRWSFMVSKPRKTASDSFFLFWDKSFEDSFTKTNFHCFLVRCSLNYRIIVYFTKESNL